MQRIVAGALGIALTVVALPALADVKACIGASEKGQQARAAGKLREAHEQFLVCGVDACPALVRKDCVQWNAELAQSMPTVVFAARDRQGKDFFDVTVAMDGEILVKKLDGKPIPVDPGKHVFRFEGAGAPPTTETVLIREGERARSVTVTFDVGAAVKPPSPVIVAAPVPASTPSPKHEHTVYPWVVVGVGVAAVAAGVVVLATAPSRPSNCDKGTETCTALPGESASNLADQQKRAGEADSRPTVGLIVGGIGVAAIAGGLAWHFLEPTDRKKAGLRLTPWTTGSASGLVLGGRF